jgi:hypothetical protein
MLQKMVQEGRTTNQIRKRREDAMKKQAKKQPETSAGKEA